MNAARRGCAAAALSALLLAALPGSSARAAVEARAELTVPPGEYTVGDPVHLTLTVTHAAGVTFDPLDLSPFTAPDAAMAAEGAGGTAPRRPRGNPEAQAALAVEPARLQPEEPDDPRRTTWVITVRPFRTGEIPLPALTLRAREGAGEPTAIPTQPAALQVASVLKTPDESPADIRGPWRLPAVWWPILAAALAAAAAAWLAWRWWKRRKRRPAPEAPAMPEPAPAPVESPYDRARRELAALMQSRLLERGETKQFHVRLSEIVKAFLGGHLGFDAVDRTTAEVLAEMASAGVPMEVLASSSGFLEACDLVKFARHRPASSAIEETLEQARLLIETGRPAAAPREEAAA